MVTVDLPLVSVIIPCFNQGQYLYESVTSAFDSYKGMLEIIIVDDGSTDLNTERYLKEIHNEYPAAHIIRQPNQGLSAARNRGLESATGDYIQFLDADDILVAGKLDAQVAHFSMACDLEVSICNFLLCDAERSHFSKPEEAIARFDLSLEDFLFKWERGFVIPIHCALFGRSVLGSLNFDTELTGKEDWLFWSRLVLKGYKIGYLHAHLAIYRQHENSMRRSVLGMSKNWLKAAQKIDSVLNGRYPMFFEASVSWFEQAYRNHPQYRKEISDILSLNSNHIKGDDCKNKIEIDKNIFDANEILNRLSSIDFFDGKPLISIIVPVYNHFENLLDCLLSFGSQGDCKIEIILIDDASTDPRVSMLMNTLRGRLKNLHILQNSVNSGISFSQNEAVKHAKGEYLAFVDCDDCLALNSLEKITSYIFQFPKIDYFFTDRFDIDSQGKVLRKAVYGGYEWIQPSGNIKSDLLDGMIASHLKVIKRTSYLAVGGCDISLSGVQDWDLALKISLNGKFFYIPEALYLHRIHKKSVTVSDSVSQFRKTNQLRRKYLEILYQPEQKCFKNDVYDIKLNIYNTEKLKNNGICLIKVRGLSEYNQIKKMFCSGNICWLDLRGEFVLSSINFLREFNSFFDIIVYDKPEVYSSLVGYLWSRKILIEV